MGTIILLSGLGTVGAWAGWDLGTKLAYGNKYDLSQSPRLRIWSLFPAILMAGVGVLFGYAMLILLDA